MFFKNKHKEKLPSNWNFKTNGFLNKKNLFTLFWFLILSLIATVVLVENFIPTTLIQSGKAIANSSWSDWTSIQSLLPADSLATITTVNILFWNATMPDLFFNLSNIGGINITFVVFFIIALVIPSLGIWRIIVKFKKQAELNQIAKIDTLKISQVSNKLIIGSLLTSIISLICFTLISLILVFVLEGMRRIPNPVFQGDGSYNAWMKYIEVVTLDANKTVATINLMPSFDYVSINETIKYTMLSTVFISIIPISLISFSAIFIEYHSRKQEKLLAFNALEESRIKENVSNEKDIIETKINTSNDETPKISKKETKHKINKD